MLVSSSSADVVVGDQRDVGVAQAELAGEPALGVGGHVDDAPAHRREPAATRPGSRSAGPGSRPPCRRRGCRCPARGRWRAGSRAGRGSTGRRPRRASSPGRRRTCRRGRWCGRRTGRRPRTSPGGRSAVERCPRRTGRSARRTPSSRIAHRLARYGIGVRRQLVVAAVPGQERDPLCRRRRRSTNRSDGAPYGVSTVDLLDVLEERVEPRPAEHADLARSRSYVASRRPDRRPLGLDAAAGGGGSGGARPHRRRGGSEGGAAASA